MEEKKYDKNIQELDPEALGQVNGGVGNGTFFDRLREVPQKNSAGVAAAQSSATAAQSSNAAAAQNSGTAAKQNSTMKMMSYGLIIFTIILIQ